MKKLFLLIAAALIAGIISLTWRPVSFEERAIALQLQQTSPELASSLAREPVGVQAVFVDYADDPLLLLNARAALMKYPTLAREVFPLYGDSPEFRDILRAYGDSVLPPIDYFLNNEVYSVDVAHYAGQKIRAVKQSAKQLLANASAAPADADNGANAAPPATASGPLTPQQRGGYAVKYIQSEGHDFLGQFVVDGDGKTKWIQTARVVQDASRFFTSGVRGLETKAQLQQPISASDLGWAAVDGFAMLGAVKLLRAGEAAAASGETLNASTRTAAITGRLARASRLGLKIAQYGKWPAMAVAAYIALRHPSIISDALGLLAQAFGMPAWLGVFLGWTVLMVVALAFGARLARLILPPIAFTLRVVAYLLYLLEDLIPAPRGRTPSAPRSSFLSPRPLR